MLNKIALWLKYRKKINKLTDERYSVKLNYKEYTEIIKKLQIIKQN